MLRIDLVHATSDALQETLSVIEGEYSDSPVFQPLYTQDLEIQGDFRRFLISRLGSTGSTWLAKLLGSHPEVHCSHEEIISQVYPRQQYAAEDVLRFVRFFAWDTKHYSYGAVGDVGSIWSPYLRYLPFTTALLVRHPARVLNTRLRVYPKDQSFVPALPVEARNSMRRIWAIDPAGLDRIDQVFLLDAFSFVLQLAVVPHLNLLIRIEDMSAADYAHQILTGLTGLQYDPAVVDGLLHKRVNQRTPAASVPEIVRGFSARQQDWYRVMLPDAAAALGYDLMDD